MVKNVLSWIIAIFVTLVAFRLFFYILNVSLDIFFGLISFVSGIVFFGVFLLLVAPLYVLIRKKFLK